MIDELGGPKHFNHFPAAWAHAMDTPFQWTKQVASHFGAWRAAAPQVPVRTQSRPSRRAAFAAR